MIGPPMHPRLFLSVLLVAFVFAACNKEPAPAYFTEIDYLIDDSDAKALLVAEIGSATKRVDIAVTRLADNEIANAILRAKERGATIRVVIDADFVNDSGIQILRDNNITPVGGNGELYYLPEPTIAGILNSCGLRDGVVHCPELVDSEPVPIGAMYRPGSFNLMSHNFFIIDDVTVFSFTRPFDGRSGPFLGYRAQSERMREVMEREFKQMHSGVFSTTLDIYNGPVKSNPQENPDFNSKSYLTDRGEFELRFNPQDRLTKTIIDDTYRARASVFIVTDNLSERFLINALNYKANARRAGSNRDAFDVRVIVNSAAQSPYTRAQLEATGVVRFAPASIEVLPTVAIFDALDDVDGDTLPRRVHVASQPLWRAAPFDVLPNDGMGTCSQQFNSDCVVIHPADYFVDGNMWTLLEYLGQVHEIEEIDRLENWFSDLWDNSVAP